MQSFKFLPALLGYRRWGCRHKQCLIMFVVLMVAYSIRSCMGVALVAMTDVKQSNNMHDLNTSVPVEYINNTDKESKVINSSNPMMFVAPFPTFNWNKKVQDMILSSFFWGYMVLQIPGGMLAHRFGPCRMLFGALLINCAVLFSMPWAATYGGWVWVVVLRIFTGLSQACIFPCVHTFCGKWAPIQERGRMTALIYGGEAIGTVLGLPMTGFIASSVLGWPGMFRVYAVLAGLTGILVYRYGADSPAQLPNISAGERKYIESGLGVNRSEKEALPVPWSSILKSQGMWSIVVAHGGCTWVKIILYAEIPSFMDKIMKVNIKTNGLLTALPFFVMFFFNFAYSFLTDCLINRKIFSVTTTRKIHQTIGTVPPAILLVILCYVPKNMYIVESLLVLICAFNIASHLGFQINHIDIAPNFAGPMMSISNFVANGCASSAPIITSYILTDPTSEVLWRRVFFVAAGFYFLSNLFYVLLGTAERAEWDEPRGEKIVPHFLNNTVDKPEKNTRITTA